MADCLLDAFGLGKVADAYIGDDVIRGISGGERRRVLLAKGVAAQARAGPRTQARLGPGPGPRLGLGPGSGPGLGRGPGPGPGRAEVSQKVKDHYPT